MKKIIKICNKCSDEASYDCYHRMDWLEKIDDCIRDLSRMPHERTDINRVPEWCPMKLEHMVLGEQND